MRRCASTSCRAGLDVDGIVGPNTWSSLFEQAGASGASLGGSNVPPQVQQKVEQTLQQAGTELAVQGNTGAGTTVGGQVNAAPPSSTTPTSQPNTTVPTTQAPASGSCSSATISTPVRGTVTSPYGPRGGRNHDGMDIAAPTGTPVHAAACGTVSLAGQQSGYGNIVCVTHTSQFSTCYAHLSRFGVSNGAQVQQGQVIGYVGCTGSCTGPHLHFETRVNGQAQNPSTYLSGGSTIPGKRATVAGTSSSATTASATTATAATQPASAESVQVAPTAEATTTEAAPVPAEAAPAGTVATEVRHPPRSRPSRSRWPVAAPTEVAAPAEVAPEPVAAEAEVAAPAEVAAEPVAVETQVAAPAEVAAPVAPAPEPVAVADGPGCRPRPRSRREPVAAEAQVAAPAADRHGPGSGRRGRYCRRAVGRTRAKWPPARWVGGAKGEPWRPRSFRAGSSR